MKAVMPIAALCSIACAAPTIAETINFDLYSNGYRTNPFTEGSVSFASDDGSLFVTTIIARSVFAR